MATDGQVPREARTAERRGESMDGRVSRRPRMAESDEVMDDRERRGRDGRGGRMDAGRKPLSTGLPGLDRMIRGVMPGDNIVWQVDAVEDYAGFVAPFAADALEKGRKLVYFRFARHPELVREGSGAEIHRLSPEVGFETFTAEIH